MKKNKLSIFIVLITAALIFSVAGLCNECEKPVIGQDNSVASHNSTVTSDSAKTQSNNNEPKPDLIHGVVPTRVLGSQQSNFDNDQDGGGLEFNNVGKLGGEQYSKAKYTTYMKGRVVKTFEGYFTGGPDGEIFLTGDGILGNNAELHGKLVDGKEFIFDDGTIFVIRNPEAFEGWTEDEVKKISTIILFSNGVISDPINSSESDFFAKLTIEQGLVDSNGDYLLGGEQTVDGCTGTLSGVYDPDSREFTGKCWVKVYIPTIHKPDEEYTTNGTFSELIGHTGKVTLALDGTEIHNKYTYGEDGTEVWTETVDRDCEVTFTVTGLD